MLFRSGTRYIFAIRARASHRWCRLNSNVRPRMPTFTGQSACFEIQQRAPRGTSAFAAFCEHFRLQLGVRSPSPTQQRPASSTAGLGASAPGCAQHGEDQAVQWRAYRAPVRNFSSGRAVVSLAGTVQGLTPRSSGAPTAGRQARSGGTRYIFASRARASHRWCRLNSNVRHRKYPSTLVPALEEDRKSVV